MNIGKLKKEERFETRIDKSLGIQTFGKKNDYPQQVMEIVGASGTGSSCVDVFSKFIAGRGFGDLNFYNLTVNNQGLTNDALLGLMAYDFAMFNGFALHLNYNANYKVTQVSHVPFETVRLGALKENGTYDTVVLHWDWGRRMTQLKKWSKEDIIEIDLFDPSPESINAQVEKSGGWAAYKGQVFYYSGNRANNYPLPKFDAVLTDMSTEEGIANIAYRNVRHNFLPSCMLVSIMDKDESKEQREQTEKEILEYQGDEAACKMITADVSSKEEMPQVVDFSSKNYDKEYTVTRDKVKNDIGRAFNQPPILRAEDVGANFGSDAIRKAYDYYNSVTEVERLQAERAFSCIFKHWHDGQFTDFSIMPLYYKISTPNAKDITQEILDTLSTNEKRALIGFDELQDDGSNKSLLAEKIGVDGAQVMVQIVADPDMSAEQKKGMLKLLFSLTDEDVESVIPSQS
jgi:hypothetical protein